MCVLSVSGRKELGYLGARKALLMELRKEDEGNFQNYKYYINAKSIRVHYEVEVLSRNKHSDLT